MVDKTCKTSSVRCHPWSNDETVYLSRLTKTAFRVKEHKNSTVVLEFALPKQQCGHAKTSTIKYHKMTRCGHKEPKFTIIGNFCIHEIEIRTPTFLNFCRCQ